MREFEIGFRLWTAVIAIVLGVVAVKGCQTVYEPESLRADAEARALLFKTFPAPKPSP